MNILEVSLDGKLSTIVLGKQENLLKDIPMENSLVVTDSNCIALFDHCGFNVLELPPGEPAKNFNSIETILRKAVELGLDRKALFIGVGGGVICDMSAFAASIYLRGCRVILFPTTLLSMVDASVGGKTGIDFCNFKNQVGTFYPGERVVIVPSFLKTLAENEYLSGLGEVIKTAFLNDPELVAILENRSKAILDRDLILLQDVIIRCIKVKGYFVENDFREGGIRAFLNLGHTFAHALETIENLGGITHGEAVAWGMYKAALLAKRLFSLDDDYLDRLVSILMKYGYQLDYSSRDPNLLLDAMQHDKKKIGNQLRFTLQKAIGETVVVEVPETLVLEILSN